MNGVNLIDMWTNFLPIANLAFAIVFAIVIYSTATGQGLTNYSVKKILPRLIICAIGVNVSFYICALLADVVNIVAVGLPDFIFTDVWRDHVDGMTTVEAAETALGGFVGVILLFLMGMVAVVALIVTVLALAARQILLSMLVIISPLAVVCAVLPSTQKWFEKWAKTYVQLLVVYPMFMLVYAGVRWFQLVGAENLWTTNGAADSATKAIILFLVNVIAPIIPAVAIYPLLKASGGVMGKLTGAIDKSPLGTQGALGKAAGGVDSLRRKEISAGTHAINRLPGMGGVEYDDDGKVKIGEDGGIQRRRGATGFIGRQRSRTKAREQIVDNVNAASDASYINKNQKLSAQLNTAELAKDVTAATTEGIKQGYRENEGRDMTNNLMAQQSRASSYKNMQERSYADAIAADQGLRTIAGADDPVYMNRALASARQTTSEATKKAREAAYINEESNVNNPTTWGNVAALKARYNAAGSDDERHALIRRMTEVMKPGAESVDIAELVRQQPDAGLRSSMSELVQGSRGFKETPELGGSAIAAMADGLAGNNMDNIVLSKIADKYSPERFASVDVDALKNSISAARAANAQGDGAALQSLLDNAQSAMANPEINSKITGEVSSVMDGFVNNPAGPPA